MSAFSSRWNRLTLSTKLQLLIQGAMLVVSLLCQHWIASQIETRQLTASREKTEAFADNVINSLNTLMATTVDDHDVISDRKARGIFLSKVGQSELLKDLHVIRGKAVTDEFGPGLPQENAVDDLDNQVLSTGTARSVTETNAQGMSTYRAVLPYIARREFRGSRCLACHGVDEGAVLGAVSVTSDITSDVRDLQRIQVTLWIGQVFIQILLFVLIRTIVHWQLRSLGAEPRDAAAIAELVAHGDLSSPIAVKKGDQNSLMAHLDRMQDSLANIVAQVRRASEGVAVASGEIAQGNTDLSARTEEQAAALEQTAATMNELGDTVRQNADSANQANRLADDAAQVARRGGEAVTQMISTMRDISEASQQISNITSLIDSIAFQTNILALNAAVEAARAGEQGRGFAVVASEVRSLASRSAAAAKDISALIRNSLERVEQGTAEAERAGTTMEDVVSHIERLAQLMSAIATASAEQAAGVSQAGEAVAQMDSTTQQNAALVEQMAAAAASLSNLAQELVQTVGLFRLRQPD
jgi:methyl-accepting chemotaxis protein